MKESAAEAELFRLPLLVVSLVVVHMGRLFRSLVSFGLESTSKSLIYVIYLKL